MAYSVTLASIAPQKLEVFLSQPESVVTPVRAITVSHYLAYGMQVEPLASLLERLIDKGNLLHPSLWHPLRAPVYLPYRQVVDLTLELKVEWLKLLQVREIPKNDWFRHQIENVLTLCEFAKIRQHCIVSVLNSPSNTDIIRKIHNPLADAEERPANSILRWLRPNKLYKPIAKL